LRPASAAISVRVEYVSAVIGHGLPKALEVLQDAVNERLANGGVLHGVPFVVAWSPESECSVIVQAVLHPL
jgi:hypothetical protein